ncbi:DUF4291 family protein [Vibrio sp. PP-XX7]
MVYSAIRLSILLIKQKWLRLKQSTPVRIQWDPERDLHHNPLEYRAIQIGLCNEAVPMYVNEWIQQVTDVTELAAEIHSDVLNGDLATATLKLPTETEYNISDALKEKLQMIEQASI